MREVNKNSRSLAKTIALKGALIFLIIMPIVSFFIISPYFYLHDSPEKKPWVSWFNDPHERVYISWETEEETKGVLKYGTDKDDWDVEITENKSSKIHHLSLTGLDPDTKYYYSVEVEGEEYGAGMFRTAPSGFKEFTWVMISDTQQNLGPGHHYRVARVLEQKAEDYSFIANVGDIVEQGADKRYYDNFFQIASHYFDKLPFVPVIGNHDDRSVDQFTEYFINQVNTSQDHFYYSFNWSNVHVCIPHFAHGSESEMTDVQLNWLENDLARAQDKTFIVVMFHCPVIGASFFGENEVLMKNVKPILEDYGVDAIIHGHEHHYERGHLGDIMYMILGGGGGAFDVGLRPLPETEILTASPCYTEVEAKKDTLTFSTFTLEGSLIDEYTIEAED
ncbi:MAG: metallophosphoesterase family protein [Promethearchaeota archaeon]|nr:MAG: metallophosphoesterase family protein [Candidatus Lokiarchaeota archaeon]